MLKEKGFYVSLICAIVCIAAFGAICVNVLSDSNDGVEGQVVAETTMPPVVTEMPVVTAEPKIEETSANQVVAEVKETAKPIKTPKAKETMKKTKVENQLHFDQETGLLWPVQGDVLIEYSADKVVFFPTLAQYKTNPALIIASEIGSEVKASASGVVKRIENNEETGTTVTVAIGDGFKVVYGQLKDLTVEKGDQINEGQVIGKVAKPTKYYSVEGANLYYQVLQKNETVNPLVLLR